MRAGGSVGRGSGGRKREIVDFHGDGDEMWELSGDVRAEGLFGYQDWVEKSYHVWDTLGAPRHVGCFEYQYRIE